MQSIEHLCVKHLTTVLGSGSPLLVIKRNIAQKTAIATDTWRIASGPQNQWSDRDRKIIQEDFQASAPSNLNLSSN